MAENIIPTISGCKSILVAAALFGSLLTAAPTPGQEIVLDLDTARTTVQFTLADVLHTVHGDFKVKHGVIRFDPSTGKISGEVAVDAASGESGSDGRDSRMHKNILESGRFQDILFVPDRVEGTVASQGSSEVQVHGTFRIHGAAHEIMVPVHVQVTDGKATAKMRFTIPYVKWGMKNPSTFLLRVSDKVDIDIAAYSK
ncbi:MAG: YceI family protein [Bryobacteraceae bacterium]|jgi:polyisoprenoid-binding protein YceI